MINPFIFDNLPFPQTPYIDYNPANSMFDGLSTVPTLFDSSGNSRNAAVDNSTYTPQISGSELINGNRTLYFPNDSSGNNVFHQYFYNLPNLSALTSGEAFVIYKLDYNPNTSNELGAGVWNLGSQTTACAIPYQDGNIYDDFGVASRKSFSSGGNANYNAQWIVYNVKSKVNDWKAYKNGSLLYSDSSAVTPSFASIPQLGHSNPPGAYYFSGWIARFIFFSPALSDADSVAFAAALAAKYNL